MDYREAIEYINNTAKLGSKLGLNNIGELLRRLGNPHKELKFIHITGTNGKGSTSSYINSILIEAGFKTGLFTSPHLQHFGERIKVNNMLIEEGSLANLTGLVRDTIRDIQKDGMSHPTEFEIITAIAFMYFLEKKCDVVVLEVGLGGRLDSTNIINTSLVSVITPISFDHTAILGNTIEQIAFEKAGIIKQDGKVVMHPQKPEAEIVIEKACLEKNALLIKPDFSKIHIRSFNKQMTEFDFDEYKSLKIKIPGIYQTANAAMALIVCLALEASGFSIDEDSIRRGLYSAKWPGRMEFVSENPDFIIDGAHNEAGTAELYKNLMFYYPQGQIIFIMGVLKDKDYKTMIKTVSPAARAFVAVEPSNYRALPLKELELILKDYCNEVYVSDTIEGAIRTSLDLSEGKHTICAFGSLYYIGKIRSYFGLI